MVESWAEKVTKPYERQLLFRRGVGLAAMLAYNVHNEKLTDYGKKLLLERIAQLESGDFDWSEASRSLFESDS